MMMSGRTYPLLAMTAALCFAPLSVAQVNGHWKPFDPDRPPPPAIDPGTASTQDSPGHPPSDAVVLFNGRDLSQWVGSDGQPAKWKVADGYFEVVPLTGGIQTRQPFGDCQLHVEFAEPVPAVGEGQKRGNSGVFLMGLYEIQVLDSFQAKTYPDGQAGALYGQYPPLVNASRSPGQWQTYDIIFHRPHFDGDGKLLKRGRVTVLHNGVLVQDNVEVLGPTGSTDPASHEIGKSRPDKLPISLQDHHNPVRYRKIWVRELAEGQ